MRASGESQVSCLISLASKFPYRLLSPKKVSIIQFTGVTFILPHHGFSYQSTIKFHFLTL